MFWIKSNNLKTKNDYLYLRETVYIRDKRSLKRSPRKLGDGKATKNRGKYSKKKDTYCGKITEVQVKKLLTFENYIIQNQKEYSDFLEYKLNSSFDKVLTDFINYLLYIYEIDKDDFYGIKKKVFFTGTGYLCKETINRILNFNIKNIKNEKTELERFANRCEDAGIYDEEIISILYMKINDATKKTKKIEEIPEIKKEKYSNYQEFMKTQYEK